MINPSIGDVSGSVYEGRGLKGYHLPIFPKNSCFTDDTVLMAATSDLLIRTIDQGSDLRSLSSDCFAQSYKDWGRRYINSGFSPQLREWIEGEALDPYFSLGCSVVSRVFPVSWISEDRDLTIDLACRSAIATHSSPEAGVAAEAVSEIIFALRQGWSLWAAKALAEKKYFLMLLDDWEALHKDDSFSTDAEFVAGVGVSIGLKAKDHEDALRLTMYVGGDTDSIGATALAIMDARFPGTRMKQERQWAELMNDHEGGELKKVLQDFRCRFIERPPGNS